MAAVTIHSDFGRKNQEEKICHYFHISPLYLPWSNGAECHDLSFFFNSFKPALGKIEADEKRASEDEMAGCHHWCNGHELGQTSGDGDRQTALICCSPRGCKELDTTGLLSNNNSINESSALMTKSPPKGRTSEYHHIGCEDLTYKF